MSNDDDENAARDDGDDDVDDDDDDLWAFSGKVAKDLVLRIIRVVYPK